MTRDEILQQIDECEKQRELLPPGQGYAQERVLLANRIDMLYERLALLDNQPARFMPLHRQNYTPETPIGFGMALLCAVVLVVVAVAMLAQVLGVL